MVKTTGTARVLQLYLPEKQSHLRNLRSRYLSCNKNWLGRLFKFLAMRRKKRLQSLANGKQLNCKSITKNRYLLIVIGQYPICTYLLNAKLKL